MWPKAVIIVVLAVTGCGDGATDANVVIHARFALATINSGALPAMDCSLLVSQRLTFERWGRHRGGRVIIQSTLVNGQADHDTAAYYRGNNSVRLFVSSRTIDMTLGQNGTELRAQIQGCHVAQEVLRGTSNLVYTLEQ